MLELLPLVWVSTATMCLTVGILQISAWVQRRASKERLWFALAAVSAAGCSFIECRMHTATSIDGYLFWLKLQHLPLCALFIALVWFVRARLGTGRRWLAFAISAAWALFVPVNLLLPFTLVYADLPALRHIALPWGETFALASGPQQTWKLVMDGVTIAFLAYVAEASWVAWRTGVRQPAVVGGSILASIGVAGLMTPLVDAGLLTAPYLISVSFLIVILAMAIELTHDVARAANLGDELSTKQRRWRAFLSEVPLLVVEVDDNGRVAFANPFFSRVTGTDPDHVVGHPFAGWVPADDRERYAQRFHDGFSRGVVQGGEGTLIGGQDTRTVNWSAVLLRDAADRPVGILNVGADITELRRAEEDRDAALTEARTALAEVQQLRARLEEEVIYLKDEIRTTSRFSEIVGDSPALSYVLHRIEQVAPLLTTVLIEGETGVGKELVARAIHERSPRASRAMIRVNCAVLPPTLIEAELFGHERGAFTGADRLHKGRFEMADHGTLFLDEIGELPLDLQAKLLRVLEHGQFERVGGDRTLTVDVRVIAATNRRLLTEVQEGRFREDLYYRLHVFPITVPPLRARAEDIPALVQAFVRRFSREQGKIIERIPQAVFDELCAYAWPGNVRELENVIERATIGTTDGALRLADRLQPAADSGRSGGPRYRGTLDDVEREYVREVLELSHWRIEGHQGAAERLGLHPNTLRFRMRKLGLHRPAPSLAAPPDGTAPAEPARQGRKLAGPRRTATRRRPHAPGA